MTPVSQFTGHMHGVNLSGATKTLFFPLFRHAVADP